MASKEEILAAARAAPTTPGRRLAVARKPSPQVEAMVARLGRGRALKTPSRWPDGDLDFDLWVLTQSERDEAEAQAVDELKERGYDIGAVSPLIIETILVAKAVHVLAAAIRDRETGERLFADGQMLRDCATDDEVDKLTAMYAEHRVSNDPNIKAMSEAEVEEIEAVLKKKDLIRLSSIASSMPKGSLLTLVGLLATSLTGKSSSTPPADTSP